MLSLLLLSLVVAAVLIQVAVFSTTIYLHRCATHHALILHPAVEWMFQMALWLTTGQSHQGVGGGAPQAPRVHRRRRRSAQPEDRGLLVRCSSATSSTTSREVKKTDVVERYARDIKDDWWDTRRCSTTACSASASAPRCCACSSAGDRLVALLAAGIHAVMYVFVLSSSINGLCHHVGYRNFDNTATNIRFLALLTGGEGLHNNHHGYPRSPKFSFRASEIDPAWPLIKLLIALKLAKPYKTIEEVAA